MFPVPNSDQHSSTQDDDETIVQNIPRTIHQLEQYVMQIQTRLGHLNSITIPHSEISTDFALSKTSELDAERNRIRTSDIATIRQLAESYLIRFKELERRNKQQAHRLDALETRVTMAETICSEQMRLNKEMSDEAIRTLRQFSDAERRRTSIVKSANARVESLSLDLTRYRNQCEQHEQTIVRLREQANALNQESTSLTQRVNKLQSDKNNLTLERDRLIHEPLSTHLTEREELIETLRERENQTMSELRERDALIESLGEERDRRDQEIVRNRREFQNLLAEKERDMEKLIETKKKEVISELKAAHRADIERYQQATRSQRNRFEEALQDALRETQRLAAQREEYYNNWRRLEETLETHKRKLHAALSRRKMVNKCSELVRDLKDIGGFENGHPPSSATPRTLEPVEGVAQRFLNELAAQRESGNFV
ncbi:hypothetical protein Mgra_00005412 [Meloidogyne graminicola]|uniref:Uncharacterized protein n=1 Tax=Meloidogyne graminicola TaxID=189291 RepID=A0A8S9ZPD9_9BILA|nr:hypothetical protein Mgra_00005412 [Meloidogyne graminicola]